MEFYQLPTIALTEEQTRIAIVRGITRDLVINKQYLSKDTKITLFSALQRYILLEELEEFIKYYKGVWPASEELEFEISN
jgi:hypothetical protein